MEQFGGKINVKSQLQQGSTFSFSMKLEDEKQFMLDNIHIDLDDMYSDEFVDKQVGNKVKDSQKSNDTLSQVQSE